VHRILIIVLAAGLAAFGPVRAQAQSGQTVADLRAELAVLSGQVQLLRDQLVQRGAAGGLSGNPADALTRLDQLEAELRRVTDRVEVLTNDLNRIVEDASNKVGDIEFRLGELEGGTPPVATDPAPQLGGGLTALRPRPRMGPGTVTQGGVAGPGAQLTVTERSDFDAAVAAAEAGDNAKAAELFGTFLATYPGGPLSGEAQFRRGEALEAQRDWRGAARSYLDAFSGAPQDAIAPRALYRLAISLNALGQSSEACLTLTEVEIRYPGTEAAAEVPARRQEFRCQ
jgi:tol-pal system protein YbgF